MVVVARSTDAHWLGGERVAARRLALRHVRVSLRTLHLTMRDGARIAVDLYLPSGAAVPDRIPTIVRQTRYLRALDTRVPGLGPLLDLYARWRSDFLRAGYAWIDVDARGTGASSGTWSSPWFDDQIEDGKEIVDWIVAQPWSSGRVGSLGISYDGTCAEMLLVPGHPAVRAVAPLFSLHDVYADVAFPGGIHHAWFTAAWSRYNAAFDRNAFGDAVVENIWLMARANGFSPRRERMVRAAVSRLFRALVRGVRTAGAPLDSRTLAERAKNLDVHAGAEKIVFRDDAHIHPDFPERTIDSFSPHAYHHELVASGAAIYGYSGWRDGAYPHSAVKRWLAVPNSGSRLTLGPWAHTGRLRIHAFARGQESAFDHSIELLDFFDEHLKDTRTVGDGARVHYFVLGEERWRSASSWPPPGAQPRALHLGASRRLADATWESEGSDPYVVDAGAGTGPRSRWCSLMSIVPGDYPDRRERDDKLLVYDGAPLDADLMMAGHPQLTVFAEWSEPDAARVFAYLEDVAPDGRISYVTEGQLAAIHRAPQRSFRRADALPVAPNHPLELTFELLPIAYLWRRGHRIRLALGCSDADHFAPPGAEGTMRVHHGPRYPSRIVLPVIHTN
jgi:putative CocE/NonD family hydrolase